MQQHLPFKKHILLPLFLLFLTATAALAQPDTAALAKPTISFSGFIDTYYVFDFNKPETDYRQPFLYNHNRHNEFNLNLGLVKLELAHSRYRGNLALQAGTYAEDNYAQEPDLLKPIFEANAGIALDKNSKLWLDAGVLPSHIGFESAISLENATLTRSLLAENSPYFMAGTRISYSPNDAWYIAALVANGWQRIRRVEGNSLPALGTQVTYSPSGSVVLNWSTFTGTDYPDFERRMRYFNNVYGQFQITEQLALTAGFDVGLEQENRGSSSYNTWYSPVLITRYTLNNNWAVALRTEYYADPEGVIISQATTNPFKMAGFSANFDYSPAPAVMCRLEGRMLRSKENLFFSDTGYTTSNTILAGSIALKISR